MPNYYVHCQVRPGDIVRLPLPTHPRGVDTQPITVIRGTDYSLYSGCVAQRSNYRVIRRDGVLRSHVVCLDGAYGYQALAYLGEPAPDCILDAIATIARTGRLDEADHAELETELWTEAWRDYGRVEFCAELVTLFDELDAGHRHSADALLHASDGTVDDLRIAAADTLWLDGCEAYDAIGAGAAGGIGYSFTTGAAVQFTFRQWFACARADVNSDARAELREQILQFAHVCRI